MDWTSFGRVRTAMTVRDYDIVMLALAFDEGIEEPTTDSFDWIRKLRSQPGFPEMIILADGGSELAAIRTLRLGAADYLPKRLLTPPRLQRSIKLTLRAIEKEAQRRAERQALAAGKPETDKHAESLTGSVKVDARAAAVAHLHAHRREPGARPPRSWWRRRKPIAWPPHAPTPVAPAPLPLRCTSPRTPAPASPRRPRPLWLRTRGARLGLGGGRKIAAESLPTAPVKEVEAGRAGKSPDSGLHDPAEDRRVRSRRGVSRDRRGPRAQRAR